MFALRSNLTKGKDRLGLSEIRSGVFIRRRGEQAPEHVSPCCTFGCASRAYCQVRYRIGLARRTRLFRRPSPGIAPVSYTHLRAHETRHDLVCRLLLEKKK